MQIRYINKEILYCFQWNFIDSNMYVLIKDDSALVIDPIITEETTKFWSTKNISKVLILLTHEHFDHINGLNWLRDRFACEVIANKSCSYNIELKSKNLSDKSNVLLMFNTEIKTRGIEIMPFSCKPADLVFEDRKALVWKNHEIELITTPGHSSGSICVLFDKKYMFTGDTLLDVPTITRLPGGNRKDFAQTTLPFFYGLAGKNIWVYPGHGNPGRLDEMLEKYNGELRIKNE